MTKIRFFRSSALEELRESVKQNLKAYRTDGFPHISSDQSIWFEHDSEFDPAKFSLLKPPAGAELFEVENCAAIHDAFSGLTPYEARDERLWAYLCHVNLLEYARARWPIPDDDELAVSHIRKHFFARDKRQVERDNAISRLWWMAHLCARVDSLDRGTALKAFLFRSDVRANLIERPTTSQSRELFGAILKQLISSHAGKQLLFERSAFRRLMKELNSVGGFKVLECLNEGQAEAVVADIISARMGLSIL